MSGLFATLAFTTPWLLWLLLPLPLIWLLLRVVPPMPVMRRFPGVVLLLGLVDADSASARTPWWLLLLRLLALIAAIVGFAGPVLDPARQAPGRGPLLLIADASWADADGWAERRKRLLGAVETAARAGRPMEFVALSGPPPLPGSLEFTSGDRLPGMLAALEPAAWEPSEATLAALVKALPDGAFETLWLSDGLDRAGRTALLQALEAHGQVSVWQGGPPPLALGPPRVLDGRIEVTLQRAEPAQPQAADILAIGLDPTGVERELARQTVQLPVETQQATVAFDLPVEMRNRLTRLEISGRRAAAAVSLGDDALRRRKVALVMGGTPQEGLDVLQPAHYLRQALIETTELIEGNLADLIAAAPDVVILSDVGRLPDEEAGRLADWVEEGGLLLRFAGPRLAASVSFDRLQDPLLPVSLRPGDRSMGGAMSWGAPRALAPFEETSPFYGLPIPADVAVKSQVLAEPSPTLASRTIAALEDGTPLVTRADFGQGQIVLFHVSASADWSNLPLSGLFIAMLDRLAISSGAAAKEPAALKGTVWQAVRVLDAYGRLGPAPAMPGVAGEAIADGPVSAALPPGIYQSDNKSLAVNVMTGDRLLAPARWPVTVHLEGAELRPERPLIGWLLAGALTLLMLDLLATLALSGLMPRFGRQAHQASLPVLLAVALGLALLPAGPARAQSGPLQTAPDQALGGTGVTNQIVNGMALAYVLTGSAAQDKLSQEGLLGLSTILTLRTSVEPGAPVAIDLERDDLSIFAFLYWPVTADQPTPSPAAYLKLNRFLQSGGLILFDTKDADIAAGGSVTAEGQRLRELAAALDIPPLDPIPYD
ncbi:MAG: DUF4159 domain-containing protein, partial [Paracoccaceae bacterium]